MTRLPASWGQAQIGDICVITQQVEPEPDQRFRYIDISAVDRETKAIVGAQEVLGRNAPSRARKLVQTGDTLVSMTRPNLNAVALVREELDGQIASTGFEVLRAPGMDPRWLAYLVRSRAFVESMTSLVQGALYPAVRSKDVRGFVAPIAPAGEQQRIADKLDAVLARVDACRERLARVAPLLERFRQSVLSAATTGRLTEDWRMEHPVEAGRAAKEIDENAASRSSALRVRGDAARVSRDELPRLPLSWAWVENYKLAQTDANAICAGPFGTIFKAKDFRSAGVPIIFLRHVGRGAYLTHKPGFMDEEVWEKQHQPYSVHGGELLVTKLGDPPGTACIYPEGIGKAMVTPDVIKMSVDRAAADTKYLMHYFNAPISKSIVEELCFGVTRLRIDLSMFKTFPIPLPPRAEQTEIVRRIETLFTFADRVESNLAQAQVVTDRLTPALLAKAFRGELVPQDPADEPAVELLRRLAAIEPTTKIAKARRRPKAASS